MIQFESDQPVSINRVGVNMNGNGCYHQNQWVLTSTAIAFRATVGVLT
jgi:hypothetical protein